ncbi:UNVERIFIED_CONTAM: hypothetical protein FKN15_023324 [Acipenser sinensis]
MGRKSCKKQQKRQQPQQRKRWWSRVPTQFGPPNWAAEQEQWRAEGAPMCEACGEFGHDREDCPYGDPQYEEAWNQGLVGDAAEWFWAVDHTQVSSMPRSEEPECPPLKPAPAEEECLLIPPPSPEEISWEAILRTVEASCWCPICGERGHSPLNCPLPPEECLLSLLCFVWGRCQPFMAAGNTVAGAAQRGAIGHKEGGEGRRPPPPQPRPPPLCHSPAPGGWFPQPGLPDTQAPCLDLWWLGLTPRSQHHQAQEVAWSPAPLPLVAQTSLHSRLGSHLCLGLQPTARLPALLTPHPLRLGPLSPGLGPARKAPDYGLTLPQGWERKDNRGLEGG